MKIRRILSALLSLTVVLSITACGGNGADAATQPTTTTTTIDDDIENPVDVSEIDVDAGLKNDTKFDPCTLSYIGNYDMTKAGDVKPAVKYFESTYGCDFDVTIVAYDQMEEKILLLIQGDQAPDLVDKQDNTFPHWMSKNMYTALDEYIDLSQPQWEGCESFVERYSWGGKHYYYPWSYEVSPFWCIYNRGLFAEQGIDDPYELYQNGDWTWDTFKQCMVDFVGGDDNKLGCYGYYGTGFINSAGATLVDIVDGKLVNNLNNSTVEHVQNYLETLRKEGLSDLDYGDYNNVAQEPVIYGNAAFHLVGGWKITDYARVQNKDPNLDIFFVPIPRDPAADDYYYSLSTFGYLVPNASKHVEAACAFINCARLSVTDQELAETTKESIMKNKKYTEEMYDFMMKFKDTEGFSTIIDESFGFAGETTEIMKKLCSDVAFDQSAEQMTWTQMKETYYNIVQDTIDYYNSYLE